jgi:DNA replication protein DnaC
MAENPTTDPMSQDHNRRLRMERAGIPLRYRTKSLDEFSTERPWQKRALAWAREYTASFDVNLGGGRGAVILGPAGTGKTHLAVAVAVQLMQMVTIHYSTLHAALARCKEAFNSKSKESFGDASFGLMRQELLVLDDIGAHIGSDYDKALFFEVMNERYNSMLPTILVSNLTTAELRDVIGERVMDRLVETGTTFVAMEGESQR